MAKILGNFHLALLIGILLLAAAMFGLHKDVMAGAYWLQFLRYLHVFAGILWIGLLYYFNFVQIPTMPKVPAELKPGVSKYIAPAALFWFRWAAVATVVLGLLLAEMKVPGYSGRALSLDEGARTIGIGMWLGLIMAANVWFVIWPNQKRALGIVPCDDEKKAKSASVAMMASRTNLILSLPMLYCMIMGSHAAEIGAI
ncbi:MAG TPA: urate hydroxylase PuuD [Allosphingosinicella sp.]|nr:urate hydroxylase PuuD [Allosphingosinicella sp.]